VLLVTPIGHLCLTSVLLLPPAGDLGPGRDRQEASRGVQGVRDGEGAPASGGAEGAGRGAPQTEGAGVRGPAEETPAAQARTPPGE